MALQKSYEENTGQIYSTAYHRVLTVILDVSTSTARITVGVYKDKTARSADKKPVAVKNIYCDDVDGTDFTDYFGVAVLDGATNPTKQAYTHLKEKIVDYIGATDV